VSVRQQIIDTLDTNLKAILTSNGYKTNIGQNVFHYRDNPLSESELPAIIYRDTESDEYTDVMKKQTHALSIEIEAYAEAGSTTPDTMRDIIEDIVKCIGADYRMGGLAHTTTVDGTEIDTDQAGKITGSAVVKITVIYRTNLWEV